ncbi:MAG: DNA-directed RNA polymerase specialized sigma24 family protein [Verrucomicrobiales bacterium]|jgi:DNA-directed RNA polymerase specialized sigma24 family protein
MIDDELPSPESKAFHTTRWTMVMRARGDAPEARAAMAELCEAYWTPVFRFLRREGRDEDLSKELTQEFVARMLSRGGIEKVDPAKGRFRSYLLGALKHFLAERRRNEGRLKRGGEIELVSMDSGGTDTSPGVSIPDPDAAVPDTYFDRQWALAVIDSGLKRVQANFAKSGKEKQFELLKPWLMGDTEKLLQAEVAVELGMTTGAVKVAIHRLRKSFGEAVEAEIAQTVDDPEAVAEELRYLIEVLS